MQLGQSLVTAGACGRGERRLPFLLWGGERSKTTAGPTGEPTVPPQLLTPRALGQVPFLLSTLHLLHLMNRVWKL